MKRIPEPLEDYHNSRLECEPRATRRPSAGSLVVAREKGTAGWRGRERRRRRRRQAVRWQRGKRERKRERERERETERRSGARGRMVRGDMGVPRVESNARAHAGGLARRLACIDQRAWQPRSVTAGAFGYSLPLSPSSHSSDWYANILSRRCTM